MGKQSLPSAVGRVVAQLRNMDPGDRGELRVLPFDHSEPQITQFVSWDCLRDFTPDLDEEKMFRRWDGSLMILANGWPSHRPRCWFGEALQKAGYPQKRLAILTRTREQTLHDHARRCVKFLRSRHVLANLTDLVRLVLYQEGRRGKRCRKRIRYSYYEESLL